MATLACVAVLAESSTAAKPRAAFAATPPAQRVQLVSLPNWSLIAWRQGRDICFNWRGERTSIEAVSGCRPPLHGALELLVGETGIVTRLAGLAARSATSVSVRVRGATFAAETKPLPPLLSRTERFFFLQFRPPLSPSALAKTHWTIIASDDHHREVGSLRV